MFSVSPIFSHVFSGGGQPLIHISVYWVGQIRSMVLAPSLTGQLLTTVICPRNDPYLSTNPEYFDPDQGWLLFQEGSSHQHILQTISLLGWLPIAVRVQYEVKCFLPGVFDQWLEHPNHSRKATGSNPGPGHTPYCKHYTYWYWVPPSCLVLHKK